MPNNYQDDILRPGFKLGVLGGGQLGKMLAQAANNWHLPLYVLDESRSFPAGRVTPFFTEGSFKNYEDVYAFGKQMDVLTIEIEHVNTEALHQLEREGVIVHPAPAQLDLIKDKGLQKQFYAAHGIPSSPFQLYEDEAALRRAVQQGERPLPFVQKSRTAGYDGKGVSLIRNEADLAEKLLPGPCLAEDLVDIDKELAVIVARNPSGAVRAFPVVEMAFEPEANLVEFLFCPASVPPEVEQRAEQLALRVIETFGLCGLLAVELFLTPSGELLVNEVAPRPHNSGHHTIDSGHTSQFEQHLRAILDLPLGSTEMKSPTVMVNLLGAPGHTGTAHYQGLPDCLGMAGVHLHLYGKADTKPFRKMGHATVVADTLAEAVDRARAVQQRLQIVSLKNNS